MTHSTPDDMPRFLFVGTYTEDIRFGTGQVLEGKGKGIYCFRFDRDTGALELTSVAGGVRNPSYLNLDAAGERLYATNELKEDDDHPGGAVSAFAVDRKSGKLTLLDSRPSHGSDPCNLMVEPRGKFVLVANYTSGSVTVLPILVDGALGDATDTVRHVGRGKDAARQEAPHAHAVAMDRDGHVFVSDLGIDRTMIYRLDSATGKLTRNAVPWAVAEPGAGPRQLVIHPDRPFAYVINELDSTVSMYGLDPDTGALDERQTVSALPSGYAGTNTCAELQMSPSGRFLYGANRGHDSLVVYAVEPDTGKLGLIGHEPSRGRSPRHFSIDPTGQFLAAANQDSDNLIIFRIDPQSGKLAFTGFEVHVPNPVCVRFL